jgi:NitT/TauT family transport system permease protein
MATDAEKVYEGTATPVGGATPQGGATPGADDDLGFLERWRERGGIATILWPIAAVAFFIGIWEILSQTEVFDPIIVPPASEVWTALVAIVQEDYFWEATEVTVKETMYGFAAGVAAALLLGTLIGMFRVFRLAFYPLVIAFQITPRVALAPLFLTWFGFGITSKVVMAATICFFPVLIGVVVGLENVDKDARSLMRSFGASRFQEYRKLALPSSLPVIFAGIKTAMTLALIGAIVAEFVGATEGMGVLIKTFNFQLQVAEGFAVIVALAIIGLILYGITELIEHKLVFWRGH